MTPEDVKKTIVSQVYDFGVASRTEDISQVDLAVKAVQLVAKILDGVQGMADEMAKKAYGDCDSCYGKGYNSYMKPADQARLTKPQLVYQLCKCARGRSLKQVIMGNPIWTDPYEKKAE